MDLRLITLFLSFLKIEALYANCVQYSFHIKDSLKDRALTSRILQTQPIEFDYECFRKCTSDCRCLSFNVCGKHCELNADSQRLMKHVMKVKKGCRYYDLPRSPPQASNIPTCCLLTNPCLHGGKCVAPELGSQLRFRCLCRPGSYGDRCQITNRPKSCADFLLAPGHVKSLSGKYEVGDASGYLYSVYCDFDSEPGFAWTLLLSFSRANSETVIIQQRGLLEDSPVSENATNWEMYRLSKSRMELLRKDSSHWRATCSYDVFGVDYQDYIRVNMSEVDFSRYYFNAGYGPSGCITIEYMKVLGAECHHCNHGLYHQPLTLPFVHFKHSSAWSFCQFDASQFVHKCQPSSYAQYFYTVPGCIDTRFRCTAAETSTTQNWYGKLLR